VGGLNVRNIQPDIERMSVEAILAAALSNIIDDERRGGDYAVIAGSDRAMLETHKAQAKGAPCAGCGDPWPCGVVRGIFAPD
jgi:hypothetical protein